MYRAIVFAGTTEGNEMCCFLEKHHISVLACVATEYGSKSLHPSDLLHIMANRLTASEMTDLFLKEKPEIVLDATHPYAAEVTLNIRKACENTEISYVRVLRKEGDRPKDAVANADIVYVENTEAAAAYLEQTTGNILLTTGSKELEKFTHLTDYKERLYARVLSLASVMETCHEYGLEGKHLIGMQGPFSKELNAAMLCQYECRYLVTKDTGKAGGFEEKIEAARECGVITVIIGRPLAESGLSCRQCKKMLAERFCFSIRQTITLLGIGMGSQELLTQEGKEVLEQTELLLGARRMVDSVRLPQHDVWYEYQSESIAAYIQEHPEYEQITIALSGDVGFFSGAKKLLSLFGSDTRVVCGISSVVYFMSRIGLSWDDAKIVSSHGQHCNLIALIRQNPKVFSILGGGREVAELAQKLVNYQMENVTIWVGENLSYENEKIFSAPAESLTDYEGSSLAVVCVCNQQPKTAYATHGIPDGEFIRGKAPMTKEEVRTISLSKLRLPENAICYDVGAGTGSVSIEMALRAHQGMVYAIEKKDDALTLLLENRRKFAADNLEIVAGEAPAALASLPVPTHAFIGGSSGNLREIIHLLLQKNPSVRIVINCITLETIAEALACIREVGFTESEIVQAAVSRSRELGRYHLMSGENPIYIITCQNHTLQSAADGLQ